MIILRYFSYGTKATQKVKTRRSHVTCIQIRSTQQSESNKIFPGSKQCGRFNRLFHDLLVRHKYTYLQHGEDPTLLGTHSIQKRAATYCCTETSHGPPVVFVCLRAGWSLGRMKEHCLKYEMAGDELVGRTLTGIPATTF